MAQKWTSQITQIFVCIKEGTGPRDTMSFLGGRFMKPLHQTAKANTATETHTTSNDSRSQRDEKGRFGKGNRGRPGNPFARQTAKLRQAMLDAVSAEDMREVIDALKGKAKQGDVAAIKLLLSYTVGKPAPVADPDTLDL